MKKKQPPKFIRVQGHLYRCASDRDQMAAGVERMQDAVEDLLEYVPQEEIDQSPLIRLFDLFQIAADVAREALSSKENNSELEANYRHFQTLVTYFANDLRRQGLYK